MASRVARPAAVEPITISTPVPGIRNPPCCGQANSPRILRTRSIGSNRIADAMCTHCGHRLRIVYVRDAAGWVPASATDMTRMQPNAQDQRARSAPLHPLVGPQS
jgi:hypothetical protein